MAVSAIFCVVFPLIFLGISAIVFSGTIDDSTLPLQIQLINCEFPNYDIGYNATAPCNFISHPTPYSDENSFGFPTGWFTYIGHWSTILSVKIGAMFTMVGIILSASVPVDLLAEVPLLAIPYVIIFIVLAYGIYKSISPFVGA